MADIKKEQEREELHRAIWAIADDLRGSVDGWDFKSYVLGTMFYRYISENLTVYINQGEWDAGNTDFDYAEMSDADAEEARDGLIEEKGFFILPSELFCNVRKRAPYDENLNMTLETVFKHIEDSAKGSVSENSFAGLFDDFDVNSNKLGATVAKRNEKLVKLLNGVGDMNLGDVKGHDIDAFGDAYEYLMTMYASNAGKSGGEFFTPADVSELLTRLGTVGKTEVNKVYDPACGSGSLLLKAEKVLGRDGVRNGFFGQEINITTYNLCRINMFLHDIGFDHFDIACEDTLTSPQHWDDEPFELIVSNPPYSIKWAGDDNPLLINDPRFSPAGVLAPKANADFAFIMHSLSWLAPNGVAAIVCFPGIMYRGKAEQKIRKYLIDNNYIDCIIQLPENMFFGTPIGTCIMVIKKGKTDNKTLFIDASNDYVKSTNNNRLTDENSAKILETYTEKKIIAHYSNLVDFEEIAENDYNLEVNTYVKPASKQVKINIDELHQQIKETVNKQRELRNSLDKAVEEMSIEQLIKNLCPDGVDYKPLWSLTAWDKKFQGVEREKQKSVINYPVLLANDLFALKQEKGNVFLLSTGSETGWTTEELAGVNMREGEIVSIPWGKAGTVNVKTVIKYYKGKFITGDNRIMTSLDTEVLDNRFLYFYIVSENGIDNSYYRGSGIKHPDMRKVLNLEIPVPPISVQREIIALLDCFTKLNAELNAELTAREKQYQYFRDKMFSFTRKS